VIWEKAAEVKRKAAVQAMLERKIITDVRLSQRGLPGQRRLNADQGGLERFDEQMI
jgi:hypothetical protein